MPRPDSFGFDRVVRKVCRRAPDTRKQESTLAIASITPEIAIDLARLGGMEVGQLEELTGVPTGEKAGGVEREEPNSWTELRVSDVSPNIRLVKVTKPRY